MEPVSEEYDEIRPIAGLGVAAETRVQGTRSSGEGRDHGAKAQWLAPSLPQLAPSRGIGLTVPCLRPGARTISANAGSDGPANSAAAGDRA